MLIIYINKTVIIFQLLLTRWECYLRIILATLNEVIIFPQKLNQFAKSIFNLIRGL